MVGSCSQPGGQRSMSGQTHSDCLWLLSNSVLLYNKNGQKHYLQNSINEYSTILHEKEKGPDPEKLGFDPTVWMVHSQNL